MTRKDRATIYHYVPVILLPAVLLNPGQAPRFMLVDSGGGKRTGRALTRRIGLSVALTGMAALGVFMGWVQPHGVGG